MTALCGGGTSGLKSGVSSTLVNVGSVAGLLGLRSGYGWLAALGIVLDTAAFNLSTLCASDPPAAPTFTAAQVAAFLNLQVGTTDYTNFLTNVKNTVENIIWYQYCQCTSGPQPTPPAATAQPSTVTTIGTGPTQVAPCRTTSYGYFNFSDTALHTIGQITQSQWTGSFFPQGTPTSVLLRMRNVNDNVFINGSGPYVNSDLTYRIKWYSDNAVTLIRQTDYSVAWSQYGWNTVGNPVERQVLENVPSNAQSLDVQVAFVTGSSTAAADIFTDYYCGGATPSTAQTCCPTDPQVLSMLSQLNQAVTLIQRQLIPYAYVSGSAHSGLTGNGTLTVTELLGIRVDVTTIPAYIGQITAADTILLDLGFVSIETPDGFVEDVRIRTQHFVWTPRLFAYATKVGYSLNPGVVITITELEREV